MLTILFASGIGHYLIAGVAGAVALLGGWLAFQSAQRKARLQGAAEVRAADQQATASAVLTSAKVDADLRSLSDDERRNRLLALSQAKRP